MSAESTTMRAITHREYGEAEVLRLEQLPVPSPGRGEVLVRVAAASLDQGAWHVMSGLPKIARLGLGLRRPAQLVAGGDLAGTVVALGPGTTEFAIGDRVFGRGAGTFAEYVVTKPGRLARIPDDLPFEQAAAIPFAGCTALNALRAAEVAAGDRVLVLGAAGGVGSFAALLAVHLGARVTGVARGAKLDFVRGLGVDAVHDYTAGPVTGRFEAIIDTGGGRSLRELRALLTPRGRLVLVGSESGAGLERLPQAAAQSLFTPQKLIGLVSTETTPVLAELAALVSSGALAVPVHAVRPLEEAALAMRELRAGAVAGKLVLTV